MKHKSGEHPFGDTGQFLLLGLFFVVWVVDSFVLHVSTMLASEVPLYGRLGILVVVLAASIQLVRLGHTVVDGPERPASVVTTGAFRYVRHPLYLGSILFYFALAAATLSLLSLGVVLITAVFYDFIAEYEEKLLIDRFGEQYQSYKKTTGKWIPRMRRS